MSISKKDILHYIIMFGIMMIIGSITPFGEITPLGMKILAITIGLIYGLITVDDSISVCMFGFLTVMLSGYKPLAGFVISGLSNPVVVMVIVSTIFAGLVAKTNCLNFVSKKILSSNIMIGSPWRIVFSIFMLCMVAAFCGMGYAGIFLIWAIVIEILEQCNMEKKSAFSTFMLSMVSVTVILTTFAFPWRAGTLQFVALYNPTLFDDVSYFKHMIFIFVMMVIFIFCMMFIAKYVFKFDISNLQLTDDVIEKYKNTKITSVEKYGFFMVVIFTITMLLPSILPATMQLSMFLNKFGLIGIIFIMLIISSFLRNEQDNQIFKISDCHEMIPWRIVWLLALIMPLSAVMQLPECGVSQTISNILFPVFNNMPISLFMIAVTVIVAILTQVGNNTVLAIVFMPIAYSLCVSLGGNPYVLFIMLIMALQCDMTTPAGSANGALVHGHENINRKYAYIFGILEAFVVCLLCVFFIMPIGIMMF